MITIEARAKVTEEGQLVVAVPPDIEPGEHNVVVVIDHPAAAERKKAPITFSSHDVGPWPEGFSVRREEIYDDWGR